MSESPQGEGWWLASDGRYYPPQPGESVPPPFGDHGRPPVPLAGRQWWQHPLLIVAGLLLCFPVGLILLWVSPWKLAVKSGVTALIVVLVGISLATAPDESDSLAAGADAVARMSSDERVPSSTASTTTVAPSTAPPTTIAPTTLPPPTAPPTAPPTTLPPPTAPPTTAPPVTTPQPTETVSQVNARRSASSYIDFSAFSRQGLIEQLQYEGFSEADAAHGVDTLDVDWNEQAADSAASYLEFSSFSRQGLVEQLLYEGFTPAQAEHGVSTTGL